MTRNSANDQMSWDDLAKQAQEGDKRAYNALLTALVPFIKSVVIPKLSNPDWAEDVTQEVLISVHKSLATYTPDRPFKPWLVTIIHFRTMDYLRKHYNSRQDKQVDTESAAFQKSHVTIPAHAGELKDIEKALNTIPEKQRKVYIMMKIKGYTAQDVAKTMGMSVSAVKVSVHRTSNKLKEMIG